jgi:ribonuclease-3
MPSNDDKFIERLSESLDVRIEGNETAFLKAFTHRSYANEADLQYDNERLEFLGDTVLDLCVAEFLFKEFPDEKEGRLSKIKSAVVRTGSLSRMAETLNLSEFIRLSKGESKVERGRDKVIADTFEAFIGALYRSSGLSSVREFLLPLVRKEVDRYFEEGGRNFKGQLLEYAQERGMANPIYKVDSVDGPEHDPTHTIAVSIGDKVYGTGQGSTKKEAEQHAAKEALQSLTE